MKLDLLTKHAQNRMQQRGMSPSILDWLQIHGFSSHDRRGAEIRYFDHGARRRIARDVGQKVVDLLGQLLDVYMVTSNDGVVIACGHRYKRIVRH